MTLRVLRMSLDSSSVLIGGSLKVDGSFILRTRCGPESRAGGHRVYRKPMGKKESAGKSSGGTRWDHPIPSARRARAYKTTRLSSQSDAARTSFRCAGPDLPARRIRPRKPTLCAPPLPLSRSLRVLYYFWHVNLK